MKGRKVLFSHASDEWETPQDLFEQLDKEFHFTLDVCASDYNHKCLRYFKEAHDGLSQDWEEHTIWCNPPYSNIADWAKKCSEHDGVAVMLVPARTDTRWFHDCCYQKPNVEIRFIKGRLKFGVGFGIPGKNSAPFPSMVVIFRNVDKVKNKE